MHVRRARVAVVPVVEQRDAAVHAGDSERGLEAGRAAADDGDIGVEAVCGGRAVTVSLPSVVLVPHRLYLQVDMKANRTAEHWSVGDLAARFDLPTNVLRHWESLGLLAPERDASGYRRYGRDDLVRVAVILRNKSAGMSLEQIRVLLDGEAEHRQEILEAHLRDLAERSLAIERSRRHDRARAALRGPRRHRLPAVRVVRRRHRTAGRPMPAGGSDPQPGSSGPASSVDAVVRSRPPGIQPGLIGDGMSPHPTGHGVAGEVRAHRSSRPDRA